MASYSAVDRRRLNPPARTYAPIYAYPPSSSSSTSQRKPAQGKVATSSVPATAAEDPALPLILVGLVPAANGSAYYELAPAPSNTRRQPPGPTPTSSTDPPNPAAPASRQRLKVLCAVYGPRQYNQSSASAESSATGSYADRAELHVDVRFASFAEGRVGSGAFQGVRGIGGRRRRPGKETESSLLASQVRSILLPTLRLSKLPKSAIDVHIVILEASSGVGQDGSAFREDADLDEDVTDTSSHLLEDEEMLCAPACVTAASVALAHAGVDMYALCVGAQLRIAQKLPSRYDLGGAAASVALYTLPALGSVVGLVQCGRAKSADDVDQAVDSLTKTCEKLHAVAARALVDGVAALAPTAE